MPLTENDLVAYIGREEGLTLDFKQSALFNKNSNQIKEDLSKCVSAFANTSGGRIIIGLEEDKTKTPPVATKIDQGVSSKTISRDTLRDWIVDNVHPRLTGIQVLSITLQNGSFAYFIDVPEGTDAYQARDLKFYGRTDNKSEPVAYEKIRSLMLKSSSQRAELRIDASPFIVGTEQSAERVGVNHSLQKQIEELTRYKEGQLALADKGDPFLKSEKQRKVTEFDNQLRYLDRHLRGMKSENDADFRLQRVFFRIYNSGIKTVKQCKIDLQVLHGDHVFIFDEIKKSTGYYFDENDTFLRLVTVPNEIYPHRTESIFTAPWLVFTALPTNRGSLSDNSQKWLIRWVIYFDDSPPSDGHFQFPPVES